MYRCAECKGENVFFDAYVNANDDTDIIYFDDGYCSDCEGATTIVNEDDNE